MKEKPQPVQLNRVNIKKKETLSKEPAIRKQKWGNIQKMMKFKIHSIFIDMFEDGILFSDYTN